MKQQIYFVDVIAYLAFAALLWKYEPASARFYAGMAISAVSFVLWMLARYQLGASFSVGPEARKLVTRGLYSRLRNPIYVFGTLAYGGLAVCWNQAGGYLIFILMAVGQWARARKESATLERAFGEEYRAYKSRTLF